MNLMDNNTADGLLGEAPELSDNAVAESTVVLPVSTDKAKACESTSRTTLPDGQPCALWLLPNITVSTNPPEAAYEGCIYPLNEQAAILLMAIVEAKSDLITAREIEQKFVVFDSSHQDRAMSRIPSELRNLVESCR